MTSKDIDGSEVGKDLPLLDYQLFFACQNPLIALEDIERLVAAGANVHAVHPQTGELPYMVVLNRKGQDEIALMLDFFGTQGADLRLTNRFGMNALHYAIKNFTCELVPYLTRLGVPLEQANSDGFTPLRLALQDGMDDVIDYLLDAGAWPRTAMPDGEDLLDDEVVLSLLSKDTLKRLRTLQAEMPSLTEEEEPELEEDVVAMAPAVVDGDKHSQVELYSYEDLKRMEPDEDSHLTKVVASFMSAPNTRKLVCVTEDIINNMDALKDKFPNFREVIAHICTRLRLCRLSPRGGIYIKPILLLSEPGAGKTKFVHAVSKVLGVPMGVLQGESISSTTSVTGMSSVFKGAKYGQVVDLLRHSEYANPVMFFDELDKASASDERDPKSSLLTLLTRDSARTFRDEFLGFTMDASHILWFAAINDINSIPGPLLSRYTHFDIKQPTRDEMPTIVSSIYGDLLDEHKDEWGPAFSKEIPDAVRETLYGKTSREVATILEVALGNAASRVDHGDGLIALTVADLSSAQRRKQGIGFVQS